MNDKKVLDTEENVKESQKESKMSKKDVAAEIVFWLRRAEILGVGMMVAPLISAVFVVFDKNIGMIIPLIAAAIGAWMYKKIVEERKRLVDSYDLQVRR